jgi:hypothetical protein
MCTVSKRSFNHCDKVCEPTAAIHPCDQKVLRTQVWIEVPLFE